MIFGAKERLFGQVGKSIAVVDFSLVLEERCGSLKRANNYTL